MNRDLKNDIIVDAVITWVDGNDENWQQKINKYSKVKIDWSNKKETIRYNSIDEITIAIKSVIKHAPFVRNIFLVTDDQTPKSFEDLKIIASNQNINLTIVDHKVIFREFDEVLPCFNSCSITTMLYNIPGLSDHFLIFNDDTFLMRMTTVDDFFKNGYPIIRGRWTKFYEDQFLRKMYYKGRSILGMSETKNVTGYKKAQQKSAKQVGMTKYIRRDHTPVSLRKSTLEKYFEGNDICKENVKYRFRNENQFVVSSLSNHLEVKDNTYFLEKNFQLSYFQSYRNLFLIKLKLYWYTINKKKLFMCFQNLEIANERTLKYILSWIDNRLK